MRIQVTSVPSNLTAWRHAAHESIQELTAQSIPEFSDELIHQDHILTHTVPTYTNSMLLAIIGWQRGPMPKIDDGGDGLRPWVDLEIHKAFAQGIPVAVLMASDLWPDREEDPDARDAIQDLRAELSRIAIRFDPEPEESGLPIFRQLVREALLSLREDVSTSIEIAALRGGRLRRRPKPDLPEHPYPVLLPYTHPDLLAGRDREIEELRRDLEHPVLITGVYAVSGTGKSSFLDAGFVRRLHAEGHPAALDRQPCEPGLAARLLSEMVDGNDDCLDVDDNDPHAFLERMVAIRRLAGVPPILVIDQFEEALKRDPHARAVIGRLLAASAQRRAGLDGPPCRWILAYRQEFHGDVFLWLSDVLGDLQAAQISLDETLPHDLSGVERFQIFPLAPLGTPPAGTENISAVATTVFLEAIETPLRLRASDGKPSYPWTFAPEDAQRLAQAFGEARARHPDAPLAPELQVVLAHLLEQAPEPLVDEVVRIDVPHKPGELIERALEDHLRRALDASFPGVGVTGASREARTLRTRALLALRELADTRGRREEGLPADSLARAIGEEGRDVLEQMATAGTRLVVPERRGELTYALSHDRLGEILVRLVDDGLYRGLGVDRDLLSLRRFVQLQSELYLAGEVDQATQISKKRYQRIDANRDALLWGDQRRGWWQACQKQRQMERKRTRWIRVTAAIALSLVALATFLYAFRHFRLESLLQDLRQGNPQQAFAAADLLLTTWEWDPEEVHEHLIQREYPFDLLDQGIPSESDDERPEKVRRIAEMLLPLIHRDTPNNPERIASLVWAVDFFGPPGEARQLRDQALGRLRRENPPPPIPQTGDSLWAEIPAGSFMMGAAPGEDRNSDNMQDEKPRHPVTLSAFRLGIYEVTNREFHRLYPSHAPNSPGNLPAVAMTWYQAYTYAAWLGGRLPTEAEAEYVRRGGCVFRHCRQDGSEASLQEVAWWRDNSIDQVTKEFVLRPGGLLEPNPWGLYDLYGSVFELAADWYGGPYTAEQQTDPAGAPIPLYNYRMARGGSFSDSAELSMPSARSVLPLLATKPDCGLRVWLPPIEPKADASR